MENIDYRKEKEEKDIEKLNRIMKGVEKYIQDTGYDLSRASTMNKIIQKQEELRGLFERKAQVQQAKQELLQILESDGQKDFNNYTDNTS